MMTKKAQLKQIRQTLDYLITITRLDDKKISEELSEIDVKLAEIERRIK